VEGNLAGVVVGHVLTVVPHPDADRLRLCQVDLGAVHSPEGAVQIVCGASNVAAGQHVLVATVGATIYPLGSDEPLKIKKGKIRGAESLGMICAEDELGLGQSHDGIMVLAEAGHACPHAPGTDAAEALGLAADYVLHIGLTPNRTDAMSHLGAARDVAARLGRNIRYPQPAALPAAPECGVGIELRDTNRCLRYTGAVMTGLQVGPSPAWLQDRLRAIGQRPINNVVDATNYVLHSIGQPLHAFDLAKVGGGQIVVRTAQAGETLVTLDGQERKLHPDDLLICDASTPLCLAGVMGGRDSGVNDQTTAIFIESATFAPSTVRQTTRRHDLHSDSAYRFARGTDPAATPLALALVVELIRQTAGTDQTTVTAARDEYPTPLPWREVTLSYAYLSRMAGAVLPTEAVDAILGRLDFKILPTEGHAFGSDAEVLRLAVPPYRVDVSRPQDVAEEVLRVYGFNNIPAAERLNVQVPIRAHPTPWHLRQRVADRMAAMGLRQISTNSLVHARWADAQAIRPLNPLSEELAALRQSLHPTALDVLAWNINRQQSDLCLFEFGKVYYRTELSPDQVAPGHGEHWLLGIWQTGQDRPRTWAEAALPSTLFTLKQSVAEVLALLTPGDWTEDDLTDHPDYAYGVEFRRKGQVLARLGRLADGLTAAFGLDDTAVYGAILEWPALERLASQQSVPQYRELPRFPFVERDLSLRVEPGLRWAELQAGLRALNPKLIQAVALFDLFRPKGTPETYYAVRLRIQDPQKTLTDSQIDGLMQRVHVFIDQHPLLSLRG
jgi:phenylalanyl-tRNA synthetase beta chain